MGIWADDKDKLAIDEDASPLEFLQAVYTNPAVALATRVKCAIAAAEYVHPRLAVTVAVDGQTFADRLDRAIKRSQTGKPLMIEGKVAEER
jgi:hypothetical protein